MNSFTFIFTCKDNFMMNPIQQLIIEGNFGEKQFIPSNLDLKFLQNVLRSMFGNYAKEIMLEIIKIEVVEVMLKYDKSMTLFLRGKVISDDWDGHKSIPNTEVLVNVICRWDIIDYSILDGTIEIIFPKTGEVRQSKTTEWSLNTLKAL